MRFACAVNNKTIGKVHQMLTEHYLGRKVKIGGFPTAGPNGVYWTPDGKPLEVELTKIEILEEDRTRLWVTGIGLHGDEKGVEFGFGVNTGHMDRITKEHVTPALYIEGNCAVIKFRDALGIIQQYTIEPL